MSIYCLNFTRESTGEPVSPNPTTISYKLYSGRITTREIHKKVPLINLRDDLPISFEWKEK